MIRKKNLTIFICVLIAVVCALVILVFVKRKEQLSAGTQVTDQPKKGTLVIYKAGWCGACKAISSNWEEAKTFIINNIPGIKVAEIDHENHADLIRSHGVKGYPTIRFLKCGLENPGNYEEYSGNRTSEDIIQFAQSELGKEWVC